MKIKAMALKLRHIEKTKASIQKLRDVLRNQITELEDIAGTLDESVNLLDDGLRAFSDATDELSKYL